MMQGSAIAINRESAMVTITATIHKLVAEATDNRDLTLRQLAILGLATEGGTEVRLASMNLAISKPACTRSADRLVEEGLLRRVPIAGDRRRALLVATAKGKQLIEQVAGIMG
jgi:DNA-binding MarR family transcriptional regulator